jgi:tetraacyldisaccharide 4'-kinase
MLKYPEFWNSRSLISIILFPLTYLFRFGSLIRRVFSKEIDLKFPIICVGNVSVGGTGKTPIIKEIARYYNKQNKKIIVISKGYGGSYFMPFIVDKNTGVDFAGDEAIELFESFSGLDDIYVICAKNPKNADNIIKKIMPDLILVDDGMQNPSFKKDFNILCIDGKRGFGNKMLLPSGPLREDYNKAIKNSDVILSIDPDEIQKNYIKSLEPEKFIEINSQIDVNLSENDNILIFSGIGNPSRLEKHITKRANIAKILSFPDHYFYKDKDIEKINQIVADFFVNKIVTTQKDYVKIKNIKFIRDLEIAKLKLLEEDILKIIKKIDEKIFKNN